MKIGGFDSFIDIQVSPPLQKTNIDKSTDVKDKNEQDEIQETDRHKIHT